MRKFFLILAALCSLSLILLPLAVHLTDGRDPLEGQYLPDNALDHEDLSSLFRKLEQGASLDYSVDLEHERLATVVAHGNSSLSISVYSLKDGHLITAWSLSKP